MIIVTILMGFQIGSKIWNIVCSKLTGFYNVTFMLLNPNAFKNLFELSVRFYLRHCIMGYCNETRNEDYILQECYIISIIYYSKKYWIVYCWEKCRTRCKLCLCLSYVIQIVTLILAQCNFFGRILQNSENVPVITFCDIFLANNFQPPVQLSTSVLLTPQFFINSLISWQNS
jgi:hypothetical protein